MELANSDKIECAKQSLLRLVNSKQKKWCLVAVIFFVFLSLDDYAVFAVDIPPYEQLKVTEGVLKVKHISGGKGGTGSDVVSLLTTHNRSFQSVDFRCRLGTRVKTACISLNDKRFYDREVKNDIITINSNTSSNFREAKVWWYEANVFGPIHDKRLMQLDVEEKRIIAYIDQKQKYLQQKKNHFYLPTTLLVVSIIVFGLLQFAKLSND